MSGGPKVVEIFCAESSHASRRVIVTILERRGGDWKEPVVLSRGVLNLNKGTIRDLDASDRLMPSADEAQPKRARWRYRLHCKLCGLTVPLRAQRLHPVLDALAAAGCAQVSLSALAATLRRQ